MHGAYGGNEFDSIARIHEHSMSIRIVLSNQDGVLNRRVVVGMSEGNDCEATGSGVEAEPLGDTGRDKRFYIADVDERHRVG
jgi:hypothetical protein